MVRLTEYAFNDKVYVDIKELLPLRPYAKGVSNSMPRLIARKGYEDVTIGKIVDGELIQTEKYSCRFGTKFVCKAEVMELFEENTDAIVEYPPAPPVIEDEDLVFFKDEEGVEYDVLMRGSRTREGIYFKVKDVERVFRMKRLDHLLMKSDTIYSHGSEYQWFTTTVATIRSNDASRELYLTYSGLKHVIEASRSGVGYKFKQWIDEIVFSAAFGTQEQKVAAVKKLLNVDADHLKQIMGKSPTLISCLYLIDTLLTDGGRRVFKYGFTDNVMRRFKEHIKTYGDGIKLDTFVLIPILDLSKAERDFKNCVSRYQFKQGTQAELISLCDEAYVNVKNIFASVSRNYCGNVKDQIAIYEQEVRDLQHQVAKIQLECDLKLSESKNVILTRDNEILQLKMQLMRFQNQS